MHPEIEEAYEKVLEIDRNFFDANPKKNEYIRAITDFELDEARILGFAIKPNAVHVIQLRRGIRTRQAIYVEPKNNKGFGRGVKK